MIYEINSPNNEEKRFDYAFSQFDKKNLLIENTCIIKLNSNFNKIFDIIKERLAHNEEKIKKIYSRFYKIL